MTKTLGDYLFLILTIFGSAASIFLFGTYFAPELNDQGLVGVIFLGIITILFLFYNIHLILKYRKKLDMQKFLKILMSVLLSFTKLIEEMQNQLRK